MPEAAKLAPRGPWVGGYASAVPAFMARPDQLIGMPDGSDTNSSRDVDIDPFSGGMSKRAGCSILNDSFSSSVGLLNKNLNFRCRRLFALDSPSLTDKFAAIAGLFGYDTNPSSGTVTFPTADSGFPATIWNNSTNSGASNNALKNHSLLEEFVNNSNYSSSPNTKFIPNDYRLKVVPIWMESGDGVYLRGAPIGVGSTDLFGQQFLCAGSRSGLQTQNWYYSPNLRCTPWRWNKRFNEQASGTEIVRIYPTGPFPPLFPPSVTTPAADASAAAWEDGDTFYISVMFQFEDGSYSRPFVPRAAQPTGGLTGGLGLATVGNIGGTSKYRYLTYTNIAVGPEGTTGRVILRSVKQNRSATSDAVTVEPLDLRVIGILKNNTQTTYVDYAGDDDSLDEDDDVVRFDSFCPRRARFIGTGDQRAILGYTLPNTAAIMLAPVSANNVTTYDLNVPDTSSAVFSNSTAFYVRITSTDLELHCQDGLSAATYDTAPTFGGANNAVKFPLATYDTVEKMVDIINQTIATYSCRMWRAQLAPGIDPTMPTASLTKTTMDLSVTTASNTTITSAGLFAPVGIVMKVAGSGISAGTYVVSKATDSSLTISSAASNSTTATRTFYQATGDTENITIAAAASYGYIRAFCPGWPVLIHMKPSAFPDYATPDKVSVYFSGSDPGAASSGVSLAPNNYFLGNRRIAPPNPKAQHARMCMGIVDVEGAAVIAYSDGIFIFRNVRGGSSGEDFDDRLATINLTRGCISYGGLAAGNGWAVYPTPDGIVVVDKNGREFCISGDIHNSATGTSTTAAQGDLSQEMLLSANSAAADSDDQCLFCSVVGTKLYVSVRDANNSVRVIPYDFSPGVESSGVEQLLDPERRQPYIWSPPRIYNAAAMAGVSGGAIGSIRNSNGRVDYLAMDIAGSTGDGRVDQINNGTDDNGTTFTAHGVAAPVVPSPFMLLSPQVVECIHKRTSALGTTSELQFANNQLPTFNSTLNRALPFDGAKTQYQKQVVPIDQGQCGAADIFWMEWNDDCPQTNSVVYSITVRYDEVENKVK